MSNPNTLTRKGTSIVAALVLLLLSTGCSVVSGGIQSPEKIPLDAVALDATQKIGSVEVTLSKQNLPSDVIQVAEEYEVTRILDNRVEEQLAISDRLGDGEVDVAVEIIGMRMRSNGTAFWWGFFAGGDWITVEVNVSKNGKPLKRFQTGTSTALGGMIYGGRSVRVGRMMKTLSKRIAKEI